MIALLTLAALAAPIDPSEDDPTLTTVRDHLRQVDRWCRAPNTITKQRVYPDRQAHNAMHVVTWSQADDTRLINIQAPADLSGSTLLVTPTGAQHWLPDLKRSLPEPRLDGSWMGTALTLRDIAGTESLATHYTPRIESAPTSEEATTWEVYLTPQHPEVALPARATLAADGTPQSVSFYQGDVVVLTKRWEQIPAEGDQPVRHRQQLTWPETDRPTWIVECDSVQPDVVFPERTFTVQHLKNTRGVLEHASNTPPSVD